jgi:hypothetical protein
VRSSPFPVSPLMSSLNEARSECVFPLLQNGRGGAMEQLSLIKQVEFPGFSIPKRVSVEIGFDGGHFAQNCANAPAGASFR